MLQWTYYRKINWEILIQTKKTKHNIINSKEHRSNMKEDCNKCDIIQKIYFKKAFFFFKCSENKACKIAKQKSIVLMQNLYSRKSALYFENCDAIFLFCFLLLPFWNYLKPTLFSLLKQMKECLSHENLIDCLRALHTLLLLGT